MTIFSISNKRFAAGTIGEAARCVFRGTKTITGVRGRPPVLTKETATKVAATAEQRAYVKAKTEA